MSWQDRDTVFLKIAFVYLAIAVVCFALAWCCE